MRVVRVQHLYLRNLLGRYLLQFLRSKVEPRHLVVGRLCRHRLRLLLLVLSALLRGAVGTRCLMRTRVTCRRVSPDALRTWWMRP